jgi:competence protein ComEC
MIVGGLALLSGLVFRPLGQVVGWAAWVFLTYTIEMVRLTARAPFASVPVAMAGWMVWGYYAVLAGLTWWFKQAKERRREMRDRAALFLRTNVQVKIILGAAAVVAILGVSGLRGVSDGKLHVTFLDVGQGDAIFIQSPSGRQVLIDGGPSDTALLSQLGRRMPFWDRSIDLVLLTHPESDHVTGLIAVLERYRVDTVVFRDMEMDSATYERWLEEVEAEGRRSTRVRRGCIWCLTKGLR